MEDLRVGACLELSKTEDTSDDESPTHESSERTRLLCMDELVRATHVNLTNPEVDEETVEGCARVPAPPINGPVSYMDHLPPHSVVFPCFLLSGTSDCLHENQEDLEQNGIPELKAGENSSDSPTRALHNKTAKEPEMGECRICQESEPVDKLDAPCACSGSMQYTHRSCLQRWIAEKGDTVCEVCHHDFVGDYTLPRQSPNRSIEFVLPAIGRIIERARMHEAATVMAEEMAEEAQRQREHTMLRSSCNWVRLMVVFFLSLLFLRLFVLMSESAEQAANSSSGEPDTITFMVVLIFRFFGPLIPFCLVYRAAVAMRQQQGPVVQENAMAAAEVAWLMRATQPTSRSHHDHDRRVVRVMHAL